MAVASSFSSETPVPAVVRTAIPSGSTPLAGVHGHRARSSGADPSRWNVQGAFPLLLIGGALLAYGVALALQTPTPTIGHFEIWEVVIVVSSTLVGAGVFSLLYAAEETRGEATTDEPIRGSAPPARRDAPKRRREAGEPPWIEGPDAVESWAQPAYRGAPTRSVVRAAAFDSPPPGESDPFTSTPAAAPTRSPAGGRNEIESALQELEEISKDIRAPTASSAARRPVPRAEVPRCADCGRTLATKSPRRVCRDCGRALCDDCGRTPPGSPRGIVLCQRCRPVRS